MYGFLLGPKTLEIHCFDKSLEDALFLVLMYLLDSKRVNTQHQLPNKNIEGYTTIITVYI
jgi:hypothetical protein